MPNLLYDGGALKVADFGLARHFSEPLGRMTPRVVTLHYRAPELLLKAPQYDTAVDMWSVGCIFGELLLGHVLLRGRTDSEQLNLIFQLVGTPTEARWPGWADLPGARDLALAVHTTPRGSKLEKTLPMLPPEGLSLMEGLLCLDPRQRLSVRGRARRVASPLWGLLTTTTPPPPPSRGVRCAAQATQAREHPFFHTAPLPQRPEWMPTFATRHGTGEAAAAGHGTSAAARA